MANLAAEIYPQARGWLLDLGATEPKVALDAYLRLLEFSVPKLSRVEVEVDRSDEKEVLELSFDELKGLVHEGALLEGEARLLASRGAAGSSAESDPNADLL